LNKNSRWVNDIFFDLPHLDFLPAAAAVSFVNGI